eukprot:3376974-Amphidinium_carterae.1
MCPSNGEGEHPNYLEEDGNHTQLKEVGEEAASNTIEHQGVHSKVCQQSHLATAEVNLALIKDRVKGRLNNIADIHALNNVRV